MFRIILSIATFLLFSVGTQAQAVRRYHQTLSVTDATSLTVEAQGQVELTTWAGSDVLVEITVTTAGGSVAVLNHLQKEGRYDLAIVQVNGKATIVNKMAKRQAIKVKGADMDEHIKYTISVPEQYDTGSAATGGKARK
jgi:hypothetical protein